MLVVGGKSINVVVCTLHNGINPTKTIRLRRRQGYPEETTGSCCLADGIVAFANAATSSGVSRGVSVVDVRRSPGVGEDQHSIDSNVVLCVCSGHQSNVGKLREIPPPSAFSGSDFLFVSGSSDQTVRLWDGKSGRQLALNDKAQVAIHSSIRFSSRSGRVYFADDFGSVFGWELEKLQCLSMEENGRVVYGLALDESREMVFSCPFADRRVNVYSPNSSKKCVSTIPLGTVEVGYVGALFFDDRTRCLLVQDSEGRVFVSDLRKTDRPLYVHCLLTRTTDSKHTEIVRDDSSNTFLSVNWTGDLKQWSIPKGLLQQRGFDSVLGTVCVVDKRNDFEGDAEALEERIAFLGGDGILGECRVCDLLRWEGVRDEIAIPRALLDEGNC